MGDIATQLSGVAVHRGTAARSTAVLQDLSLQVERNQIVAILGASGKGKTTLLHAVAGLLPLAAGTVEHNLTKSKLETGLVFQKPLLLPWLTVLENVQLGFRFAKNRKTLGLTAQQQKARVEELLNVLGISELAQRKVSDLSGGQAQRVAIARTIVLQPSLLLLDEPFSALDAATRKELQQWLLDLRRKLGLTVILVTHDIDEAFELADRILVLGPLGTAPTEFAISELKIATSITKAAQPKLDQTKQLIIQKLKENK